MIAGLEHALVAVLTAKQDGWREMMQRCYTQAMQAGCELAGLVGTLSDGQSRWIDAFTDDEAAFYREALRADEAMSFGNRAKLYGGGVSAAFWNGWLSSLPADARIYWLLRPADHCATCVNLASRSPWTQRTLPTVPRNGDTECLTNCRCTLKAEQNGYVSALLAPLIIEVTSSGNTPIDAGSAAGLAAAALYDEQMRQYVYGEREGGPIGVGLKDSAASQIAAIASNYRHGVRFGATDSEISESVRLAEQDGYTVVKAGGVRDDLIYLLAIVLIMDRSRFGRITAVDPEAQAVWIDGERVLIGPANGAVLLVQAAS